MGIDINISGATKLVGLVGSPVEHSMSPVMHSDSFQKMGVNAVYTAFDVTPDKLPMSLRAWPKWVRLATT